MSGTHAGFSADAFRAAIRSAMTMGTPAGSGERVAFHLPDVVATTELHDTAGVPYDPDVDLDITNSTPLSVYCVVEALDATGRPSHLGDIRAAAVRITLLDEDYDTVAAADRVTIRGDTYRYDHEVPATGLFDVTVHTVTYRAVNQT